MKWFALLLWLAAAPAASAQDLPRYEGADRVHKALPLAQKEGALTLYTSFAEKDLPPLLGAFEKRYGIKVRLWRSASENVLQRTVAEAAAGRHDVDAVHTSAIEMEALYRESILQPVAPPHGARLLEGALRPHRGWIATYLSFWVQAYNTNLIRKEDLPRRFEDLLDPRWKGKLGIEARVPDWYSALVTDMGEEKGIRFFRELVANNGISVRGGHTLLNNLVIAGDVPLALTMYQYIVEGAKRKGAPVDWIVLEPAIGRMSGVGVARHAAHPNAALLFYEFMLSPQAQQLLLSLDYVPTLASLPSPLAQRRYKLIDPGRAMDEHDKWLKSFEDVIVKRSPQ
ncbi:MAG TPA: extracellular solute-binding protein [Burkholderiales bacterium]|nr:extracellular solute-binding protein [Burkholderiales bacterium]